MVKDWRIYALHILDSLQKIKLITERGDISSDFILYDAILRNLQTLAESTTHLPETLKLQYSHINWRGINGFRNILVHDYLGNTDAETIK